MKPAVAVLLLALVAMACVADVHAKKTATKTTMGTPYCYTSAYKLPCHKIIALKRRIMAECKIMIDLGKHKHHKLSGCCELHQKATSMAVWNAYKMCEEKSTYYKMLSAKMPKCARHTKTTGKC